MMCTVYALLTCVFQAPSNMDPVLRVMPPGHSRVARIDHDPILLVNLFLNTLPIASQMLPHVRSAICFETDQLGGVEVIEAMFDCPDQASLVTFRQVVDEQVKAALNE
jgi:hypothetical protein